MGIIRGMENFWKTNRWGGIKGGLRSGWDRKQKTQIFEVDISNKHGYSYAVLIFVHCSELIL